MKRWLPFITLISLAAVFIIYLIFFNQIKTYTPGTHDPAIIYKEACAECHGRKGEGNGLLYPALRDEIVTKNDVIESVRNGHLLMPSFPNIPDSTLEKLAEWVSDEEYLKFGD